MQRIIFLLVLISAVTGQYLYVISPKLHLFRIVVPLGLLLFAFQKVKIDQLFKVVLIGFSFIFFYTLFISFFNLEHLSGNDVFNYIYQYMLCVYLLFAFYHEPEKKLKLLYQFSFWMIVVCGLIAFYEFLTGNHLPHSSIESLDFKRYYYIKNVPTAFNVNSNDLAAVISLLSIYYLSFRKLTLKRRYDIKSLIIVGIWGFISYATLSRLNILIFIIFNFFYAVGFNQFFKHRYKLSFLLIFVVLPVFYFFYVEDIYELLGSSNSVRFNLYLYSFISIIKSYGIGYGVNLSSYYFESLNRPDLFEHIINPHSYQLELLINSGVLSFLIFLGINLLIYKYLNKKIGPSIILLSFLLYHLVLFSSSSSLFLWPHFILFFSFVGIIQSKKRLPILS